jgi:poly-gamma-glutamate synthesis protein (capsule biosynthesis protein)
MMDASADEGPFMLPRSALSRSVFAVLVSLVASAAFAGAAIAEDATPTVPATPTVTATITVTAVGDMTFSSSVGGLVARRGANAPFSAARAYLTGADVTVGNLETPLSRRGRAVPGKTFTFRGSPSVARGLSVAGFDLVGQGNNHARDFGALALKDTITNLDRAGIAHAGAGLNRSAAFKPAIIERNGAKIAYLSYSQIGPASFAATSRGPGTAYTTGLAGVRRQIAAAHKDADYVIVSFHWGVERSYKPTSTQVRFGRMAIDAGADAVLSHHPHVIQGVEYYKGRIIAYSLGNFVFSPGSAAGHDTMILTMQISPSGVSDVRARAMFIDSAGRPTVARGRTARRINGIIGRTSRGRGTKVTVADGVVLLRK